jgi:glycosyltransferase involved in cell wall biosynthesis
VPNGGYDGRQLVPAGIRHGHGIRVVTPGRLIHLKGVSLAIRAVAAANVPDLRLTVIGDGPERRHLERLTRRLEADVTFTGWLPQEDLFQFLAGSDILLFPSLHDECGFVVLEAMAHGLVPVVIDNGGPPMLVGDAGLAVRQGGRTATVAALAEQLRTLAVRPERRLALRKRACLRAQRFEWRARHAEIRALYGQVIGAQSDDGLVLEPPQNDRSDV